MRYRKQYRREGVAERLFSASQEELRRKVKSSKLENVPDHGNFARALDF